MAGLSTITVDLAGGEVVLGDRRVVLTAVSDVGAFAARFRLDDGAVVRLIGFGERSRLVRDALADDNPAPALMTSLRAAAHEGPCGSLADAVLLAMAGGAEEAPEFDRCAVEASRMQAWSWLSVHDAPAIVVDRAVADPRAPEPSGGWTRVVFAGSTRRELEALVDDMLASLLTRGTPISSEAAERPEDTGRDIAPMRARVDHRTGMARPSRPRHLPHGHTTASHDRDESASSVDAAPDPVMTSSALSPGERPASSIRGRRRMMPPHERRETEPTPASVSTPPSSRRVSPPVMRSSRRLRHGATAVPANHTSTAWSAEDRPVSLPFPRRAAVDASEAHGDAGQALALPAAASTLAFGVRAAAPVPGAIAPDPVEARVAHEPVSFDIARANAIRSRADLLDEIAQALAAECDLRGIDV